MKCVVGIDLGSTTTKAVLLDEHGAVVAHGITNSRSNYEAACAIAREEALVAARFAILDRVLLQTDGVDPDVHVARRHLAEALNDAFRLELYLDQLSELGAELEKCARAVHEPTLRESLVRVASDIMRDMHDKAPRLFRVGHPRKSDFFRDLAAAAFMSGAETACASGKLPFERVAGLFDRAILDVESRTHPHMFEMLFSRAVERAAERARLRQDAAPAAALADAVAFVRKAAEDTAIGEVAFAATGYGRQTLPFARESVRSEILCHGRGAHAVFGGTRTVLDIGGQDTKAIQVDEGGVVTSFQMNDRCAAGCGRYLGYIADELGLGLHELGPLALGAKRVVRVNSTCTVFAGAELRERLALGQRREDILAGLHRAMMLRAMSLLARSGGVRDEFTFTGGVCKNPMATKVLKELVVANYGEKVTVNIHPDSIYMGARGAALFALDDFRAGHGMLPPFVEREATV